MNQILVTKKLYVTPELKRKKKIYKIDFIVSVFLIVALISFYIYAAYDRTKEEEVAKDILTSLSIEEQNVPEETEEDDVMVIALDEATQEAIDEGRLTPVSSNSNNNGNNSSTKKTSSTPKRKTVYTQSGAAYTSLATLYIPAINVKYPVLLPAEQSTEVIEQLLKVSTCKFWGPEANEVGNFCIVGHNYRNTKFFSKVPTLKNGDIVELTDVSGEKVNYAVYDKYTVTPDDVECTSQLTNGRREVTLITCTDDSEQRWIVKCREVK